MENSIVTDCPNQPTNKVAEEGTPFLARYNDSEHVGALLRYKLLIYMLVSALSFTFLVITPGAGVSVPIFVFMQVIGMYVLGISMKQLYMYAPVFVLALNSFISANHMWRVPNIIIGVLWYGVFAAHIIFGFSLKDTSFAFIRNIAGIFFRAIFWFPVPIKWGVSTKTESISTLKRAIKGVVLSVPILVFIIIMLARADMIFSQTVTIFFEMVVTFININTFWRIIFGLMAGLYVFGVFYCILVDRSHRPYRSEGKAKIGDCMIINIMLSSVLLVYTLFVAIQFRYLFAAPNNLPGNLNFVEYARRGFFELLFLTFINITLILIAVGLTKTQAGSGAKFAKYMCLYLCVVTVVLLISSFYRMWLYSSDDGLTRLRTLVFGFLFFELVGLVITFFYVAKPKFNIILVYCIIGLCYYMVLNLVPIDRIVAHEQINRYFASEGQRGGIRYVVSLSADAAPEVSRLLSSNNQQTHEYAEQYFLFHYENHNGATWRQWNLSSSQAAGIRR